jgi:ADP-ribose pyrophosphatase
VNNSDKDYKILESKKVFQGKIFTVSVDQVKTPNGKVVEREVLSHFGAVGIVPLIKRQEVILVQQYRHAVNRRLWEIPAGKLDRPELPGECAKRELQEETGAICSQLTKLAEFYNSPGYSSEKFYLYLAEVSAQKESNPDGEEELDMEMKTFPLEKSLAMINSGEICDAKSIIGILMAERWIRQQNRGSQSNH